MVAGHARCSCMPSMTSGTPDDSCVRMITSRFLSETETRGISRKRRPLEMSPSRVHPAEVRKGPGGIFLDEKQNQRACSSLLRGHVQFVDHYNLKKDLSGPRCSRYTFANLARNSHVFLLVSRPRYLGICFLLKMLSTFFVWTISSASGPVLAHRMWACHMQQSFE